MFIVTEKNAACVIDSVAYSVISGGTFKEELDVI